MQKLLSFFALLFVTFTANAQNYTYDVNNDGQINITDVTCLVNNILGVSNPGEDSQGNLSCPDDHHPHLINLGLPSGTLWSCCNVGAAAPQFSGDYFAWGETENKDYYSLNTYIHYDKVGETCIDIGDDIAGTEYDVAHVQWGGSWVMPSHDQQVELMKNCSTQWTTIDDVEGRIFTGPNGNSIFLPAAGGNWNNYFHYGEGDNGYYWSSTLLKSDPNCAYNLYIDADEDDWYYCSGGGDFRYSGHTVRPVSK